MSLDVMESKSHSTLLISALYCVRREKYPEGISLISLYIKSEHECRTYIPTQVDAQERKARSILDVESLSARTERKGKLPVCE
ncbi:hypothetical protein COU76_00250 [Candidatus Peregrinibacteria bacterium CG10_big_fil_rev_8_21_14_0_10_49_10]|nr:MAG: hypothetical protein COU76_00250 [Candidatus Peregrinibacteria bacterium CG10_big_fil_rev_8_21_14_0_10_49_10]